MLARSEYKVSLIELAFRQMRLEGEWTLSPDYSGYPDDPMRFGEHEYPDSVLTKDRKGNLEVRNLLSRGEFLLHDYRDPATFKPVESNKQKLYLKSLDGTITEFFIIPTKSPERALLIHPKEKEEKNRTIWNEKARKQEELWG